MVEPPVPEVEVGVGVGVGVAVGTAVGVGVAVGAEVGEGVGVAPAPLTMSCGGFAPSLEERARAVPLVVDNPKLTSPLPVTAEVTLTLVQAPAAAGAKLGSSGACLALETTPGVKRRSTTRTRPRSRRLWQRGADHGADSLEARLRSGQG